MTAPRCDMPEVARYQQYEVQKRADGSFWELGRGSMGVTYKAYDANLRRTVALKVINDACLQSQTARQRFVREARAAAALRHPNVASVFDLGAEEGSAYFYVMEFIEGETLEERVRRLGPLRAVEALKVASQVACALGAAARQQLVHRDLKPSNLMWVDQDGHEVVKVIDFGLAKTVKCEAEGSAVVTLGSGFVGTPCFASPEQAEQADVDVRSDIYSLGATLYYLVTGRPPFSGSMVQVISQHLYKPVPIGPLQGQPAPFIDLLLSMMEKDREKRPQTPAELRDKIQHSLEELHTMAGTGATVDPGFVDSVPTRKYRIEQSLDDHVLGKAYRGFDLEHWSPVSLLVLHPEFVADRERFKALEDAVNQVRNAHHPALRRVIALETLGGQSVLVEELLIAPSLRDVLRARGSVSAAEAVTLLEQLAPVADHASMHRLRYIDFGLSGVQLFDPAQGGQDAVDSGKWAQKPLTQWPKLTLRVAPLDLRFACRDSEPASPGALTLPTWPPMTESLPLAPLGSEPKGSYVRQLGLL
ncbi:MAG: protein kinase, partial [Verrucomicrobia bacterium]|nr:protein kinase [Verrucomicrobiota bacterium]